MATAPFRALIADDSEPWRRLIRSILEEHPDVQVVGEVADGPEAVQRARELQPDLVLLDIGLPTLNGIETARQIRKYSPGSKILFVSQESSDAVVQEALRTAEGYVIKADAAHDLPAALQAVLRDECFVGSRYSGDGFSSTLERNAQTSRSHEVGFYVDDRLFLDDATQFIGSALKAGNAAIVVLTERHRESLLSRLQAYGIDIEAAVEQNRLIAFDAAEALGQVMRDGMPDSTLFLETFGKIIQAAANPQQDTPRRVAIFGEGVQLLWAQGNPEAVIQIERLCNEILRTYDVDMRCSYFPGNIHGAMDDQFFGRICAEHSAVYSTYRP
jgi:DNA-binding NarL/FixJ family response regulator